MCLLWQSAWMYAMFMLSLMLTPCIAENRNVYFDTPDHCNKTFTVDSKNYVSVKGGQQSSSNNNSSFFGSILIFQAASADDHLCVQINQLKFKNDNLQLDYHDSQSDIFSAPTKTFKYGYDYELPAEFCSTGQTLSLQLIPRHQSAKISDAEIDIQVTNMQVLNKSHQKGTARPIPVWAITIILTAIIISTVGLGVVTVFMRKGKDRNRLPLLDAKQCRCLLAIQECNPALCVVTEAADSESEDEDYWACPKTDCGSTNPVQRGHCKECDTPKPEVMVRMHGRYTACDVGDNGSVCDVETGLDNITDGRVEMEFCESACLDKDHSPDIEDKRLAGCHSNDKPHDEWKPRFDNTGSSVDVKNCGTDSGFVKPKSICDSAAVKDKDFSVADTRSCVTKQTVDDVVKAADGVGGVDDGCGARDNSRDDVIVGDVTEVRKVVDFEVTPTNVADVVIKDDVGGDQESSGCCPPDGDVSQQEDNICTIKDSGISKNSGKIDSGKIDTTHNVPVLEMTNGSNDGSETDVKEITKSD